MIHRLLITIYNLRLKQIVYRIKYFAFPNEFKFIEFRGKNEVLKLNDYITCPSSLIDKKFKFLNLSVEFNNSIDWNYNKYGSLWNYNLNYFDFLNQKTLLLKEGLNLISSFNSNLEKKKIKKGLEPYPISIRGVNWIKFLSKHRIYDNIINSSLFSQYRFLLKNLEFHLLGNHLLENAFSLLFAAYFFKNSHFYKKSKKIIIQELKEQILNDGMHFELSPMYHQIILVKLLDCINLIMNNDIFIDINFKYFLKYKAELMLGAQQNFIFKNGSIPLLNDCAENIAPKFKDIVNYSNRLNISAQKCSFSDSGYRKYRTKNYEMFLDLGKIGPDYIPGHGHCDMLSFELHVNEKPIIVDTGTSTYENSSIRYFEKSTHSHNTVMIDNIEQSQIWGSFRVGKRAKIRIIEQSDNLISGEVFKYGGRNICHNRKFILLENKIEIFDNIINGKNCIAFYHFHPDVKIIASNKNTVMIEKATFKFVGANNISVKSYYFSPQFNIRINSKVIEVSFSQKLKTQIHLT